ncbi:MAG: universal stress protein [Synechococcaceae cyanobacterium]
MSAAAPGPERDRLDSSGTESSSAGSSSSDSSGPHSSGTDSSSAGSRGRLKVFIGMAPGVGKTFRMLQEGLEQYRDGQDVLIGLLETHGRADTARAAEGLPQWPRLVIEHRGLRLGELDVAGLIQRRPQLLLVDELAHNNAPGSRHPKRWQDVEELLRAGIDVTATLNIQHLESLTDLIERLTGMPVQERIPDQVLQGADAVVLVDITPETLEDRLRDGKVLPPERVPQALSHFFQRSHLVALRELALRQVAEQVEAEIIEGDSAAVSGIERLLVCISADVAGERILRRAARLAQRMDAPLLVVHALAPRQPTQPKRALGLERLRRLCVDLELELVPLQAEDPVQAIAELARQRRISKVVLGQSRRPWWRRVLRPPLSERLRRQLGDEPLDLLLLAQP